MAQTDIETIESLPAKEVPESQQKPLIDLVEKIIKVTKTDNYLKNTEKQAKVRDIVHQNGLTDDEIKIVEGVDK